MLSETVEKLLAETQLLRTELAKYKPEINLEFDYDDRKLSIELKQNGKLQLCHIIKQDLDYYDEYEISKMISDELSLIYTQELQAQLLGKVTPIKRNIEQMQERNQW